MARQISENEFVMVIKVAMLGEESREEPCDLASLLSQVISCIEITKKLNQLTHDPKRGTKSCDSQEKQYWFEGARGGVK